MLRESPPTADELNSGSLGAHASISTTLEIHPKRVALGLALFAVLLAAIHAVLLGARARFGDQSLGEIARLFDLGEERNIPTLFATLLLLLNGLLLAAVGKTQTKLHRQAIPWYVLSAVFIFLSVDEFVSIHEPLSTWLRLRFRLSGFLYYAWIIPYVAITAILACFYVPWVYRLPARTRALFVFSAAIFLTGAVGCEMIGGWLHSRQSTVRYVFYATAYSAEELLELSGLILFAYALLEHLRRERGGLVLALR